MTSALSRIRVGDDLPERTFELVHAGRAWPSDVFAQLQIGRAHV